MSHAEVCPVCKGSGKVFSSSSNTTATSIQETCHGCDGDGWIIVDDNDSTSYVDCPHDRPKHFPYDYDVLCRDFPNRFFRRNRGCQWWHNGG